MHEPAPKSPIPSPAENTHTVLGRTVMLRGQLTADADLLIDGQFEGDISLEDFCLTVGTEGHVKAGIRARQVVILGSVTGNLSARERIEIRRTGHVVGNLVAATVAIEDGAFFKGSIDIARDDSPETSLDVAAPSLLKTNA